MRLCGTDPVGFHVGDEVTSRFVGDEVTSRFVGDEVTSRFVPYTFGATTGLAQRRFQIRRRSHAPGEDVAVPVVFRKTAVTRPQFAGLALFLLFRHHPRNLS